MPETSEYRAFVEKFEPRRTTDDCFTPPEVYDAVLGWVVGRYRIDPKRVVRPFYPGGDYEAEEYREGWTVVDNPPFSLLSKIIGFYQGAGVPFFLFAPSLTCLSGRRHVMEVNHILSGADVTYTNGAKVHTGFVTNLDEDGTVLESAPDLGDLIRDAMRAIEARDRRHVPRYSYPDNVMTAAKCAYLAEHHTPYRLNARDCTPISKLDSMGGKGIYGGGLLLSERAAAERAAAERAAAERAAAHRWELSERELEIVRGLG